MSGVVVQFPAQPRPHDETAPHPYDFWYALLCDMPPARRQATIKDAQRCGVIAERDAYILATSWPEDGRAG